jgi:hypothetical protein
LGVSGSCHSIIGELGQSLGFLLFPSLEGFEAFVERADAHSRREGPLDLGTSFLSLNFDRGADLPPAIVVWGGAGRTQPGNERARRSSEKEPDRRKRQDGNGGNRKFDG